MKIPVHTRLRWPSRQKLAKASLFLILAIMGIVAVYLVLLSHPGLFFRYVFTQNGFIVCSDEPIAPSSTAQVLGEVEQRLARTPLYRRDATKIFRIYICNQKWRFILFANTRYHVGGLTYPPITNNIFLRAAHLDANRLVGPSGQEVPGERTLSYYITHEIMHTLMADALGPVRFWRLPSWKGEGYADYIAKGGKFDYEEVLRRLRKGARELDPQKSGLYLRYHLLVAYLLDRRGVGVEEMLNQEFDPARLESEILAVQHGS